jgi:DNA-binding NarL/FixJ family response regulator
MLMKPLNPQRKIRIMLVEDHVLVRMGLISATNIEPDMEVVAEVEDGRQAVEIFRKHLPDVVVLDLRMPGMDGIEIMRALRGEFGPVRILVLSSFGGGDDITRAMQEGACGYLVKGMGLEHLLEGIRTVHAGGQYLPREIASRMTERINSELSVRELEVLRSVAKGMSNKEIASALGIVEGTVKAHITNILTKLGAADRTQAMAIAMKRQILQLE